MKRKETFEAINNYFETIVKGGNREYILPKTQF
jgi:hypothetical protein